MVSRPQKNPRQQKPSRPQDTQGAPRGQQNRPKKQQGTPSGKSVRNTSSSADRSPGSGVGAHVDAFIRQHVSSHIGHQIDANVKQDISDQVRSHLGEDKNKQTDPTATTSHGSAAAGDLLSALRSPQGVRQAILIAEVLGKPKALRR
ncbi:MAG: hypothetical protein O2856_10020 [Planctomycetota bacterium]|nr:hypothetical protein [Planctomycetota bacterium]